MMRYRLPRSAIASSLAAVLVTCILVPERGSAARPRQSWREDTPESQGVRSDSLGRLLEFVLSNELPLHNLLVIRHGTVVLDAAVYPYEAGTLHDVASVTKSVTALLIGIAIDKGAFRSVDERVISLLPQAAPTHPDSRLARVTVADLLTMRSGFACDAERGEHVLSAMRRSGDWAAYTLALPFAASPGERFAYCSSNSHLLSSVLSARTGASAREFARRHLFAPLDIHDFAWPADPQGRTHGWGDLQLHPRDLARLGLLYLNGGEWNGRRIVSADWLRRSTTPHVLIREGVAYGYGWWLNTTTHPYIVEAHGRGGQLLSVLPGHDAVVVVTGGGLVTDQIAPFLLEAIDSERPLPPNPRATARLNAALAAAKRPPQPHRPAALPGRARSVSGRTYVLDANPLGWRSLSLHFSGADKARVTVHSGAPPWSAAIGLDGRYRFTRAPGDASHWAARGTWHSNDEFLLDLNTVSGINHFLIRMTFTEQGARLTVDEKTGELTNLHVAARLAPMTR